MPIWFAEVSYDDWILYEKKEEKNLFIHQVKWTGRC